MSDPFHDVHAPGLEAVNGPSAEDHLAAEYAGVRAFQAWQHALTMAVLLTFDSVSDVPSVTVRSRTQHPFSSPAPAPSVPPNQGR